MCMIVDLVILLYTVQHRASSLSDHDIHGSAVEFERCRGRVLLVRYQVSRFG
jgi:hypothetical protein